MEEYRKIAKLIFVPSLVCLLSAASVILLAYSYFLDTGDYITGISFLSFSILILVFYLIRISGVFPARGIFLHLSVPLIISILLVLRIFYICRYLPVGSSPQFTASVESVKALRYSNEVKLLFADFHKTGQGLPEIKAVSYTGKDISINPGDEIIISSTPAEIKYNPEKTSSLEINLLREGIHYSFYLNNKNFVISKKAPLSLKDKIRGVIDRNISDLFDEKTAPLIRGLYFANGNYIDKSTSTDFKRAGVLHILAASGEHIGIIAGAIFLLLTPLLISRKILHVLISLILLFYLYITDMPVSLLRAFVMYYIFSIQYIFDLEKNIFNTLFLSALVILAWHPYELFSLGFQLSFGATFGIILFSRFYRDIFSFFPSRIAGTVSATFAAQIFVFPVIFSSLGEINLTGLISNIILIFTMSATLILSIAANMLFPVYAPVGRLIAQATGFSYSVSLEMIRYFSKIKGHFVSADGGLMLLPYLMFVLPVIPVIKNKKILMGSLLASMACAWFILSHDTMGGNRIAVLNTEDKMIVILRENDAPVVFGTLEEIEDAELIAKYMTGNNARNIKLFIPAPDYRNLRCFMYLIKKTIVSECYMSRGFVFSGYLKKFCGIIDGDGIKLNITDLRKITAGENEYDPSHLRDILDFPSDNIAEIHSLLTEDYDSRSMVIEEIINCGYTIEYLK